MTTATTTIPGQREREDDDGRDTWPLVERAQAGDAEAFGELYRLYHDQVHTFVKARLYGAGRQQTAEDIAAAVFLRAFVRIPGVRYQGRDIAAWFVTIARNLIADHYKSAHARLARSMDPVTMAEVDTALADEPHVDAERGALREDIEATLMQLTPEQANVIRLRYLDGLDIAETAAALGITPGAVKAVTFRAARVLRKSDRLGAYR